MRVNNVKHSSDGGGGKDGQIKDINGGTDRSLIGMCMAAVVATVVVMVMVIVEHNQRAERERGKERKIE